MIRGAGGVTPVLGEQREQHNQLELNTFVRGVMSPGDRSQPWARWRKFPPCPQGCVTPTASSLHFPEPRGDPACLKHSQALQTQTVKLGV